MKVSLGITNKSQSWDRPRVAYDVDCHWQTSEYEDCQSYFSLRINVCHYREGVVLSTFSSERVPAYFLCAFLAMFSLVAWKPRFYQWFFHVCLASRPTSLLSPAFFYLPLSVFSCPLSSISLWHPSFPNLPDTSKLNLITLNNPGNSFNHINLLKSRALMNSISNPIAILNLITRSISCCQSPWRGQVQVGAAATRRYTW